MAIVKCKKCGEDISDKAKICPHCGAPSIEEPEENTPPTICEECGAEIPEGVEACPKCGCPAPKKKDVVDEQSSPATENNSKPSKGISSKTKKILVIAAAAIVLVIVFVIIGQNTLTGDDKIAYEIVFNAAKNFKDPSSVRLVSGTVSSDKNSMDAGISAKNGWGARATTYYFIMMDGDLLEIKNATDKYTATDKLNIPKINKKLEAAFKYY